MFCVDKHCSQARGGQQVYRTTKTSLPAKTAGKSESTARRIYPDLPNHPNKMALYALNEGICTIVSGTLELQVFSAFGIKVGSGCSVLVQCS